jgi:hypothetical protein
MKVQQVCLHTFTWLIVYYNTRETTLGTWANSAAGIRRAISSAGDAHNNLTDAEKATLASHATWLESIPVEYEGINHWKIEYPDAVMPSYIDPDDVV